jgi:hypothetical protein
LASRADDAGDCPDEHAARDFFNHCSHPLHRNWGARSRVVTVSPGWSRHGITRTTQREARQRWAQALQARKRRQVHPSPSSRGKQTFNPSFCGERSGLAESRLSPRETRAVPPHKVPRYAPILCRDPGVEPGCVAADGAPRFARQHHSIGSTRRMQAFSGTPLNRVSKPPPPQPAQPVILREAKRTRRISSSPRKSSGG